MAVYSIIRLSNFSPLHIGTGRDNYDSSMTNLQSDTLTAALAAVRAQQGETDDLEAFLQSFSMSSAFPYSGRHLLLPVPQGRLSVSVRGEHDYQYRKLLKKVRYVDRSLWLRLLAGEHLELDRGQIQGEYILEEKTSQDLLISKSQVSERVGVPRDQGSKSEPFYFEWRFFDGNSGLFVLTDAQDEKLRELLQLFEALGQEGIGTDRSVGGGKFDVAGAEEWIIEEPTNTDAMMLLSMYIPTEDELAAIDMDHSIYSIALRGGFIAGSQNEDFRHLRKKSVYMFDVGSILHVRQVLNGKVVNLRPAWNDSLLHPVYRSGKPLCLPVKIKV